MIEETISGILVFKTNIHRQEDLRKIAALMDGESKIVKWNIDREDIDKVLRIETEQLSAAEVILLLRSAGFICEELPD